MEKLMTKRAIKSQRTKDSILKASIKLMTKYGPDALTVKNICDEAGVSNGSFYHFFKSKDDIYAYFLLKNHTDYIEENQERLAALNIREQIIDLYMMHLRLCCDLGLEFTSAYYSTSNGGLDIIHRAKQPGFYYIADKCGEYLAQAKKTGYVKDCVSPEEAKLRLATIATGVFFSWCVTHGGIDPEEHLKDIFNAYIDSLVTEKFHTEFEQ